MDTHIIDLASKWGPLSLPATASGKLFFTDTNLRLAGGGNTGEVRLVGVGCSGPSHHD